MSLYLDRKHGVAPALMACPLCGKDSGLALLGTACRKLQDADGNPIPYKEHGVNRIQDQQPCRKCQEALKAGAVAFVEVCSETDRTPTGRVVMLSAQGAAKFLKPEDLPKFQGEVCHCGPDVMAELQKWISESESVKS